MTAALAATTRLTGLLRDLASALVSPSEATLLKIEPALMHTVDELRAVTSIDSEARALVLAELQRARAELQRCRTLGANATALVTAILRVHGHHEYDSFGAATSTTAPAGGHVEARL
jgi:hypothetical protein